MSVLGQCLTCSKHAGSYTYYYFPNVGDLPFYCSMWGSFIKFTVSKLKLEFKTTTSVSRLQHLIFATLVGIFLKVGFIVIHTYADNVLLAYMYTNSCQTLLKQIHLNLQTIKLFGCFRLSQIITNIMCRMVAGCLSSPRGMWAFDELRRCHTRPLRLNWGPKMYILEKRVLGTQILMPGF